jgi:hypothetical protein
MERLKEEKKRRYYESIKIQYENERLPKIKQEQEKKERLQKENEN